MDHPAHRSELGVQLASGAPQRAWIRDSSSCYGSSCYSQCCSEWERVREGGTCVGAWVRGCASACVGAWVRADRVFSLQHTGCGEVRSRPVSVSWLGGEGRGGRDSAPPPAALGRPRRTETPLNSLVTWPLCGGEPRGREFVLDVSRCRVRLTPDTSCGRLPRSCPLSRSARPGASRRGGVVIRHAE